MTVPGLRHSAEKVGGIVFFGRMLDKIRLNGTGQLPPGYNLGTSDWNWFDSRCTRFLGITYERLVERVLHGGSDEEILAWCLANGRKPAGEEVKSGTLS